MMTLACWYVAWDVYRRFRDDPRAQKPFEEQPASMVVMQLYGLLCFVGMFVFGGLGIASLASWLWQR